MKRLLGYVTTVSCIQIYSFSYAIFTVDPEYRIPEADKKNNRFISIRMNARCNQKMKKSTDTKSLTSLKFFIKLKPSAAIEKPTARPETAVSERNICFISQLLNKMIKLRTLKMTKGIVWGGAGYG